MAGLNLKLKPDKRSFRQVNALLTSVSPEQNRNIWKHGLTRMAVLVRNNVLTNQLVKGGGPVRPRRLTNRSYDLANSVVTDFSKIPKLSGVLAKVRYASVHEFGGRNHPARPFLQPALASQVPRFAPVMIDVINEEMAKATR
jgi:phage gpG-like protein